MSFDAIGRFVEAKPLRAHSRIASVFDRLRVDEQFGRGVNSEQFREECPDLTDDGCTLVFFSDRPGGQGYDLWMATRESRDQDWNMEEMMRELSNRRSDEKSGRTS